MTAPTNTQPNTQPTNATANKKTKKPLTELSERELQRRLNIVWEQKAKVRTELEILRSKMTKTNNRLKFLEKQEQELDDARHKLAQKK